MPKTNFLNDNLKRLHSARMMSVVPKTCMQYNYEKVP